MQERYAVFQSGQLRSAVGQVAVATKKISGLLLLTSFASMPFVASAQDSGRQLEEILVVAQKKGTAENLQEVPAAITAFNADQLDGIVFEKLDDLSYSIPNVQLEQVGTFPGVQNFSIRGQGINSSLPSVDPTVGVFVDGVYQGTTYGTVLDTWDLESVEVLRGPQGLLFGRNVTGGAVTVRTARPDPSGELGIKAKASMTNEEQTSAGFAIEMPLIQDRLAGKVVLFYDDDDGYFQNVNTGATSGAAAPSPPFITFDPVTPGASSQRNAGKLETKIIRPTLVWTPTDDLEFALIGESGSTEGDGAAWTVVGDVALPGIPNVADGSLKPFTTALNDYGFSDIEWNSATLEFNWDIAGGTLTNIAGWREVQQSSATDVDGTFLPAFLAAGATDQDQWSNELRFATTIGDFWDATVGVYYLSLDIDYQEGRYIQVVPPPNPGTGTPVPDLARIALGGSMETETYGVFWNNDIHFAEVWTLTAGIRYSNEDKDAQIINGPAGGGGGVCADLINYNCSTDNLSGSWDNWTPKLGLKWQFSDNSQAYAFWTKGFRAGGFNFRNAKPGPIPPLGYPAGPTQQEEQNSYEVGLKTQVFDDRLRMNLAYFFNQIDDMQRELNQPDAQVVVLQATVNAGDVEISGFEFEFQSIPVDQLNIYGSIGYLDGKYTSKNPLYSGINPATGAPYIGDELPRLADWSFSLGAGYDFLLGTAGILNFRADYGYRDPNFYDDANTQLFDAQHRLSGSINWFSPEDTWTVSLFGKNLRNEANYGNLTSIAGLFTAGPMQKGKEYGLQVQYRL